ncbi:hypothetical protein Mt3935_06740, partial [Mycobacterium tuberculosis]
MLAGMDAITQVPVPANEPVHDYAPKSPERTRLRTELASLADHPIDLPHVIGADTGWATASESTSCSRTGT